MSYVRVMIRGSLPGGETWSCNPAYNDAANEPTWNQAAGQNAADAIAILPTGSALANLRSTSAPITSVRIERRSDTGVLIGAAEATAAVAGVGNATKPFQTSVVLSLRTDVPGANHRGRLYWPALGAAIGTTDLRLFSPSAATVASGAVTYLQAIQTELDTYLHPSPSVNFSRLCVVSQTTGVRTDVARVQVGNVLDVQRRRRDKLQEAYDSASY